LNSLSMRCGLLARGIPLFNGDYVAAFDPLSRLMAGIACARSAARRG
jgi:hypothetical protein